MPHPFRFGVQIFELPAADWRERVRRIESLGYSTIFWPDHFGPQWEPVAALAAVAAAAGDAGDGGVEGAGLLLLNAGPRP